MAGPAPKTEKWTARENLHEYKDKPDHLHLFVGGTVEVSDADKQPVLKLASGGGPKKLTLDLSIEPCSDPAVNSAVWKAAHFDTVVEADQYNSVDVRWDGKVIASTPVINDIEHSELLGKQANLQNKAAAKQSGSGGGAGKSPVKKAMKRVVEAVGEMAEGAKKTVKKVLKKVTKAAPKKAAAKKTAKKAAKSTKKAAKSAKKVARKAAKSARKTAKKAVKKAMPKKKAKRR